jgi:hypothetical protein
MRYAILCYSREDIVAGWSREKDAAVMASHQRIVGRLAEQGKAGPVVRLMPTTTATSVRSGKELTVLDGPFAETKEQLLGFYVVECGSLQEAIDVASELVVEAGVMEIRPIRYFADPSQRGDS